MLFAMNSSAAGRGEQYMGRQGCRRCEAAEARLLRRRNRQMLVDWHSAALLVLMLVSIALAVLVK